ncbi:MAG: serine/threonine-protein kinase [Deltaproteobacteria bacterium]
MPELPEVGEYRMLSRIAVGGMAEIFRAEPLAGGEPVVLKRLLPQYRADPKFVERFVGEAKLCVKLRHPNVVRTHKLFKKGLDYFMVQELVDGATLGQLLEDRRARGAALPLAATLHALAGLLSALDYLHRAKLGDAKVQIVHRDVGPANLLLSKSGEVKLTDFGVTEASLHPESKGESGALVGTPAYMSPEQVLGRPLDARSDLFSAGSVLYECLGGRCPFAAEVEYELLRQVKEAAPPPLPETVPGPLRAVAARAMAATPDGRFQTASELRRALLAAGQDAGAVPDAIAIATAVADLRARGG